MRREDIGKFVKGVYARGYQFDSREAEDGRRSSSKKCSTYFIVNLPVMDVGGVVSRPYYGRILYFVQVTPPGMSLLAAARVHIYPRSSVDELSSLPLVDSAANEMRTTRFITLSQIESQCIFAAFDDSPLRLVLPLQ